MTDPKSFFLSSELHEYVLAHSTAPDEVLQWIVQQTRARTPEAAWTSNVPPEQGAFMTLFTELIGAVSAVEVGTFTGYSSVCIARGLAPGGRLLCCDVLEEFTAIAREAWEMAGVADRIDLRIAPAIETLRALPQEESVDLAFIDADKASYASYYEELLPRLRPNGVILVDNTLWFGRVLGAEPADSDTEAIRAFNDHVAADDRVESTLLTIGDGLTVVRKR